MRLLRPVDKRYPLTQKFGARPEVYGPWGFAGHEGIDFAAPIGTPVIAAADGSVWTLRATTITLMKHSTKSGAYGNRLVLRHANGSFFTVYAHLDAFAVHEGDVVKAGQVIGTVGNTGNSTGPHLHFSLLQLIRSDGYQAPIALTLKKGYYIDKLWYHDPLPFIEE